MKKVLVCLMLFLLTAFTMPIEVKADLYGVAHGVSNAFKSCDKLTDEDKSSYGRLAWLASNPKTDNEGANESSANALRTLYSGGTLQGKKYEGYNKYSEAGNYTVENCYSNAVDVASAVRSGCQSKCQQVGCSEKGECPDDGKNARGKQHCKSCMNLADAMNAQLKADGKAGRKDAEETDKALSKVVDNVQNAARRIGCGGAAAARDLARAGMKLNALHQFKQTWNFAKDWTQKGFFSAVGGAWKDSALRELGHAVGDVVGIFTPSGAAVYSVTLTAFLSLKEGCWFCPIFDTIYDTANTLATNVYDKLRGIFLSLLAILGVGWLMFNVLKFITTLHAPNIGEFMTRNFKTLGLILIVAAFLHAEASFLTGYFVDAPALMALDISDKILEAGGFGDDSIEYQTYTVENDCPGWRPGDVKTEEHVSLCDQADSTKYEGMAMSAILRDRIICLLRKVSVRLIKGIAMGATFIVVSFRAGFAGILPSFSMFVVGILVFCCYFALFIKIPIHLIDIVLKLCFLIITLPIYVVCFPFPSTRGYTKKAWEMLLSILVHIISLCIFVALALSLIEQAFDMATVP